MRAAGGPRAAQLIAAGRRPPGLLREYNAQRCMHTPPALVPPAPPQDTACPEVLTARRPRQEQRSTTTPGARAFERAASSCATSRVRRRRDPITSANLASNRQRSLGPGCSRPRVRCAAQLQSQPQCHRPCLHTHDARCAPLAGCPFLASGTRSVWQADHNQFAP